MSIAIATPVSTLLKKATEKQLTQILALSDVLEVRDHLPIQVTSPLPRICHCELSIVEEWNDEELSKITSLVKREQMTYVSFHVHSCYHHPLIESGVFVPTGTRMSEEEMIQNAAENMRRFRKEAGIQVIIGVENNNYYKSGAYESVTDPGFLSRLIDTIGGVLLLDIAHAEITAKHTGTAFEEYLKYLPLNKVIQIHLSGPTREPQGYQDSHLALGDIEWAQYHDIAPRCPNARYITIEYYKDPDVFIRMLEKLRTI